MSLEALQTTVDVGFDTRNIAIPVVGIVSAVAFGGLLFRASSDDSIFEQAPTILLVIGGLQTLFGVFGLFIDDIATALHMMFFASTYLFVGFFPDRPLAAKFTAAFGAINFMCLLGSFSLLGYGSSPFDIDGTDVIRCAQYFNLIGDSDVTRCTSFLNTVAICYLMLAMLQPFGVAAAFMCFNNANGGFVRRKNNNNNSTQMNQMNQGNNQPPFGGLHGNNAGGGGGREPAAQYGAGPVPPSVLAAHESQRNLQTQPSQGGFNNFGPSPGQGFGGGGFGGTAGGGGGGGNPQQGW